MDAQQPTTVLVADDSPTVRAVVRMELEGAGYSVVEAEHGERALAAARDPLRPIDVVLLDVEMPVLDGFGTIAALKADLATVDLPVVFRTSRTQGEDVVDALRLGAHDYLRKPPDATELLADVDHFKAVNDQHGHDSGDRVLQVVAGALTSAVRTEDLVGRWGGEEFLVLAPFTDGAGAAALGERLRTGVVTATADSDLQVTVSIGAAVVAEAELEAGAVLRAADRLLYEAKAAGRDQVRVAPVT